jgi:hypothetical protein
MTAAKMVPIMTNTAMISSNVCPFLPLSLSILFIFLSPFLYFPPLSLTPYPYLSPLSKHPSHIGHAFINWQEEITDNKSQERDGQGQQDGIDKTDQNIDRVFGLLIIKMIRFFQIFG